MEDTPSAKFGDLLRRFRLAAGLTQEELAERAQISPRAISDLERVPTPTMLRFKGLSGAAFMA